MQTKGATGASYLYIVLALGLALRFVDLQDPLTDKQAWRQTDTAAIARNFYEEGYLLFYPRVDWRGTTPGYVETNFPLYPFVVALLYAVAEGSYEWLGRLVAALCSTAAAALLYWLALRLGMGRLGALLAALLYLLFPMSIYYGRTFMPEALMILLSVGSLWAFARWIDSGRRWDFALAALLAALCFLVKIPTLYLGFPLVALAWVRWGWHFVLKPALWLYLVLVLVPAILWYWHANLLFEETGLTFGIWNRYGYDKWDHSLLFTADFYWTLVKRFWQSVYTPAGAVLVLAGLALAPAQRREWTLWVWMGGAGALLLCHPRGQSQIALLPIALCPSGGPASRAGARSHYRGGCPIGGVVSVRAELEAPLARRFGMYSGRRGCCLQCLGGWAVLHTAQQFAQLLPELPLGGTDTRRQVAARCDDGHRRRGPKCRSATSSAKPDFALLLPSQGMANNPGRVRAGPAR